MPSLIISRPTVQHDRCDKDGLEEPYDPYKPNSQLVHVSLISLHAKNSTIDEKSMIHGRCDKPNWKMVPNHQVFTAVGNSKPVAEIWKIWRDFRTFRESKIPVIQSRNLKTLTRFSLFPKTKNHAHTKLKSENMRRFLRHRKTSIPTNPE